MTVDGLIASTSTSSFSTGHLHLQFTFFRVTFSSEFSSHSWSTPPSSISCPSKLSLNHCDSSNLLPRPLIWAFQSRPIVWSLFRIFIVCWFYFRLDVLCISFFDSGLQSSHIIFSCLTTTSQLWLVWWWIFLNWTFRWFPRYLFNKSLPSASLKPIKRYGNLSTTKLKAFDLSMKWPYQDFKSNKRPLQSCNCWSESLTAGKQSRLQKDLQALILPADKQWARCTGGQSHGDNALRTCHAHAHTRTHRRGVGRGANLDKEANASVAILSCVCRHIATV